MRMEPITTKIGEDHVTYFSMVSSPTEKTLHEVFGRIAIEFGRLEFLVKTAIEKLSRELAIRGGQLLSEDVGFAEGMMQAEKEYTFASCCIHLGRLFEKWTPHTQFAAAFAPFVVHLQEIGEERNAIIHGCWAASENGSFLRLRSRYDRKAKVLHQAAERYVIEDLEEFFRLVNHRRYLLAAAIGFDIGHLIPVAAPVPHMKPNRGAILTANLLVAAETLGINRDAVALSLGVAAEDMNDMAAGRRKIDIKGTEHGRATFLANLLRRLLVREQGDTVAASRWLHTMHPRLGATPVEAMQTVEGLLKLSMVSLDE